MIDGVDYAFPPHPSASGLAAAGKKFAVRYGGPGTFGKHLTAHEAQALCAAGLSLVANAEGRADGLLGGWPTGVSWARSADAHFRACGMPPGRPIYLSVDFDVTAAQWPVVANALRGAAFVLGADRVGVYGSYNTVVWAGRDRVAAWRWQTYAWSGGKWAPGNHLEQHKNNVVMAGGVVDLNRALTADYGQWTVGQSSKETDVSTTLIQWSGSPAVFLSNGVIARWVRTPRELADIRDTLAPGLALASPDVQVVTDQNLVGQVVGPRPPEWGPDPVVAAVATAVAALDERVILSDADLAAVTAALIAAPETPLGEADQPAIETALRRVLAGGLVLPEEEAPS